MRPLSGLANEAGQQDMGAGYYMLTLVLHDQDDDLAPFIEAYRVRHGIVCLRHTRDTRSWLMLTPCSALSIARRLCCSGVMRSA